MARRRPRRRRAAISFAPLGLTVAIAVLIADQWSKWWVLHRLDLPTRMDVPVAPFVDFTMVWNGGVTFGLFQVGPGRGHLLLGLVALAITVMLVRWMHVTTRAAVAVPLGMIVGGALGNIADRLRYGLVVDFVRVHALGWSWYVFNLADACIVCGVAALLIDGLRPGSHG